MAQLCGDFTDEYPEWNVTSSPPSFDFECSSEDTIMHSAGLFTCATSRATSGPHLDDSIDDWVMKLMSGPPDKHEEAEKQRQILEDEVCTIKFHSYLLCISYLFFF
jgi:hypothetical protein